MLAAYRVLLVIFMLSGVVAGQEEAQMSRTLPPRGTTALATSLEGAKRHASHVWRDTAPFNENGTVNVYIEIPRGERRKWEFDIAGNARRVDRVIPSQVGGYPVNYGYVPQTVSYDGDPFDALVLGPALPGGRVVQGVIVGVMYMEDEKGLDSKVVLSRVDASGRPLHPLTSDLQQQIGDYFASYKKFETGAFSEVPGWGTADDGRAFVTLTHTFFQQCRNIPGSTCTVG